MSENKVTEIEVLTKIMKPSFGETKCMITAIATVNGEEYDICYHRNEPSGVAWIDSVKLPEHTTENTLIADAIEDIVEDYLNS